MSHFRLRQVGPAVLLLAFASAATARADSKPPAKEAYLGHLVDISRSLPSAASRPVRIWIDRLTTDDEAAHLADLAHARGVDALEKALEEDTVGRVQLGDRTSDPVAYARRFRDADGEHLVLVSRRPIAFREYFNNQKTADYPFTVIELDLDAQGHGSGEVLNAARFRVKKSGEIDVANFDSIAARLVAVQPLG